jgi:DivIVA domain-containing protein
MPLTPEDVANKRFPTSRFRAGYEPEPVDQFLDEVEQELYRLLRENDDLRSRLTAAQRAVGEAETRASEAQTRAGEAERRAAESQRRLATLEARAAEAEARAAEAEAQTGDLQARANQAEARVAELEARLAQGGVSSAAEGEVYAMSGEGELVTEGAPDTPQAATGLLALAQRTAEEYVSTARAEADRIVGEAHEEADRILGEAEERRRAVLGTLERDQADTQRRVEDLKTFEREYRTRLRDYLTSQLAELDRMPGANGGPGPGADA